MSTPTTTLYRLFDGGGQLLYIGIARHWPGRMSQHAGDKPWWPEVTRVTVEAHPDRDTALAAERDAIVTERPIHNVVHNRGAERVGAPGIGERIWVLAPGEHGGRQGYLRADDNFLTASSDLFIVTWFSWWDGDETYSELVDDGDVKGWRLYLDY